MLQSLYQPLLRSIKIKSLFVFLIIHAGALLSAYGLASLPPSLDQRTWYFLLTGVSALYGGVLIATFFILWPVYSLMKTVRKILDWKNWLLHDLPQIIAVIPPLVQTIRSTFAPNSDINQQSSPYRKAGSKRRSTKKRKHSISKTQSAA